MLLYRRFLRALGVAAVAGLALGLACGGHTGGSNATGTFTLTGKVTYTRIPLAKDANGVPTGLVDATVPANLQVLPARGVTVRAYQRSDETLPNGTTAPVWVIAGSSYTDANGAYSFTLPNDKAVMVEVLSAFNGGDGHSINLVGDPAGIGSSVPAVDRLEYALRKAVDGTAPDGVVLPSAMPAGTAMSVDFAVGLTDKWWLVNPSYNTQTMVDSLVGQAIDETTLAGRTTGTGSRVLAVGDSIASFVAAYGRATPGLVLDLHYAPGVSDPRGSFVEYDLSAYPLNAVVDPVTSLFTRHYFGSLQAGANDDAWDEGVLFRLLARNFLFKSNLNRTFGMPSDPLPPQGAQLTSLSPDMAVIEGLTDAMAANLLHSPYLADTQGTGLAAPVVDIRDLSGLSLSQLSPFSAPALRALAWQLILKANSLPTPGTATDWGNINTAAMVRFFNPPAYPSAHNTYEVEPLSIYSQVARLQEAKGSTDPVDLAALFPDSTLTPLLAPFGLPWPRPTTGPLAAFAANWGADPNSLTTPLNAFTLSMASAVQVNGAYPNQTPGEVAYAGFTLSADRAYTLTVSASPALAGTAQLELVMPTFQAPPMLFSGSGGSQRVVLPGSSSAPTFHPVRLRLLSPTAQQPDTTVTVSLVPAS